MNKAVVLIVISLLFPLGVFAAEDPLLGKKAPSIMGREALASKFIKLRNLNSELGYERDSSGKLVEKDGKYVLKMTRNVVVLNFFSTSCIPCIREIPAYNRIAAKYKNKNARLIYVNVDSDVSEAQMEQFISKRGITVPMMLANPREAARKYDVTSLPRMVVISPKGKVVKVIRGFSEDLEEKLSAIIDSYL
jgi:thiol-disulfide isomerase/thioredoxin